MTQKELKARYDAGDTTVSKYVQKIYSKYGKVYAYDCYRESQYDKDKHKQAVENDMPDDEFIQDGVKWKRIPNSRVWCSEDGVHIAKWILGNGKFRDLHQANEHGYKKVSLTINEVSYCTTAHRVIAYCFGLLDSLDSKLDVDHINNNRSDNRLSNLQAVTHKANCAKRDENGNACAKKVVLIKNGKEHHFASCVDAARWLIDRGIATGKFESVCCNLCVSQKPYGYIKRFED